MRPAKPIAAQRATPPLPADIERMLVAGLRSREPVRKRRAMAACLAARAFAAGFARGADPLSDRRRHIVDDHHEHWLAGHAAGQRAADDAQARYVRDHLLPFPPAGDANSRTPSAHVARGIATPRPERSRAACAPSSLQLPLI